MPTKPHLHFLGIAGSFMAGVAKLAQELGYEISGSDTAFYPPAGDAVRALGVPLFENYAATCAERPADLYIIGNFISRGNPLAEDILRRRRPHQSAPQWLAAHILRHRRVCAVAGTHGKTTTASLLAYLLDRAGLAPGFLLGGVDRNFATNARLSAQSEWFVIEADEYDCAFFDKRPKFIHYHPQILVINNLEFDHADIYADVDAIIRQFHFLLRTVPDNGRIIARDDCENTAAAIAQGCWTPIEKLGTTWQWHPTPTASDDTPAKSDDTATTNSDNRNSAPGNSTTAPAAGNNTAATPPAGVSDSATADSDNRNSAADTATDNNPAPGNNTATTPPTGVSDSAATDSDSRNNTAAPTNAPVKIQIHHQQKPQATVTPPLPGKMNRDNFLAAAAAAAAAGIPPTRLPELTAGYTPPCRRLQPLHRGSITLYDDFAHHPTAIAATLAALRELHPKPARIIAAFERGSNTMNTDIFRARLAPAFAAADILIAVGTDTHWLTTTFTPHPTTTAHRETPTPTDTAGTSAPDNTATDASAERKHTTDNSEAAAATTGTSASTAETSATKHHRTTDNSDTGDGSETLNTERTATSFYAEPDPDAATKRILTIARPGDTIILMSNRSFGNLATTLTTTLP